jgi:hypothetical protein
MISEEYIIYINIETTIKHLDILGLDYMDEQEKVLFKYLKKYPKNLTIKRIKNHLKSKKMTKTKEIITKKYIKKFCINHKLENVFGKESILLKKLKRYLQNNIGNVIKIQNIRKILGVNRIQNIFRF